MKLYLLKKSWAILVFLFFAQTVIGQKIVILHTNDMHSKLTGFGPELAYTPMSINDDDTKGGFARLATLFNNEKAKNPESTLIVDAGDFLMGTIFHAHEQNSGFQLRLMKKMGYDFITLGNHEFDFGPDVLAKIIRAAKNKAEIPQIVASNLIFSTESSKDDDLESLFNEKSIVKYSIIKKNGLKIGIIGIVGKDADNVAPNAKPVRFANQVKVLKVLADKLKNQEQVDLLICLSHSGFYPDKKKAYVGEDLMIAQKVKNIDVIISGHTHVKSEKAIKVNNTLIVQTGSYVKNLGRLELNISNRQIKTFQFKLIPVDDKILGDEEINHLIDDYKQVVSDIYFKPFGLSYEKPVAESNFIVKRNSLKDKSVGTMGQFVADAIKYYVDKHDKKVDLAIVASGTIREEILPGKITAPDIFRVSPLGIGNDNIPGYPLAKIFISAKEVKKLMEVIVMTQNPGDDSFINFSGMTIDVDKNKMMLRKVQKVYIDGKELDVSKKNTKLYSITASSYLLQFISRIKKISHGLIKIIPKDKNGNPITDMNRQIIDFDLNKNGIQEGKTWVALIEYIESFKDTYNDGLVEIPEKYKQ